MGKKQKILLIVIDGCRPDGIVKATTPTLDRLVIEGSSSFEVKTVTPSITLPAHFSIFSSASPIGHNVLTNTRSPDISPDITTIFQAANYCGLSTAAFYSWEHLRNLTPPGLLDYSFMVRTLDLTAEIQDLTIVDTALPVITTAQPDFCFVYLEGADIAGHAHGWMSQQYVHAISLADQAIEKLLSGLTNAGLDDMYTICIVSDHGGTAKHHNEPVHEVLTVPWICSGPLIRRGYQLKSELSVLDITPTLASLLQIPLHRDWQGCAQTEMFSH